MKSGCISFLFLFLALASFGQGKQGIADSMKNATPLASADSLSKRELHKIDSATKRINRTIDSLTAKGLPTARYQKKIDSINLRAQNLLSLKGLSTKANQKVAALRSEINVPQDSLKKKISRKEAALKRKAKRKMAKLDSLSAKVKDPTGQMKIPSTRSINPNVPNTNLPGATMPGSNLNLNVPGTNLSNETSELSKLEKNLAIPQSQELKQIENDLSKVGTLPKQALNETGISKETNAIKSETREATALEKQAADYKKNISKIKEGDSATMATLDKNVEKAAANTAQGKAMNTQLGIVQTQKNSLEQYKDIVANLQKGNLKDIDKLAAKEIKNPFIGQEAKLKAGVAQLDKLKKKYHTIPDSRYLPKHVPNEMKGKPLKERLVPGLSFQVYQQAQVAIDFSPYLMFRLTGRLRLGVGASDRTVINQKTWNIGSGHVQALRAMVDFRTLARLYFHIEEEWTHYGTVTQRVYRIPSDPQTKVWNQKLNMGILKTYKISNRLDGQAQLLYNTLDWTNFPQYKNTTVRFGLEYKFGVKKSGFQRQR